MYVTYEYYNSTYGGSTIPSEQFTSYERKARTFLNQITFDRLTGESVTITDNVKECLCEIMECNYNLDNSEQTIQSETVDSHSVTYAVNKTVLEETEQQKYYKIAKRYLSNTGLLYRGIDRK